MVPFVFIFSFVLILANIQAKHTHSSSHILRHLLSPRSLDYQSPIIVIVDTRGQTLDQSDESQAVSDERADDSDDEETYQLYSQLRSHPEDGLSSGEVVKLKETKQVLRAALRSRCIKMNSCTRTCPPVKKFTCVVQCQQKFDKENVCEEPEPICGKFEFNCKPKQKWGKTMPPSWLMF
ncbi:hypothetical protein MSG28_015726 [Choristoneura fumiferana]|uniref:Uncharacterized protein n=1 Tax=Choristoneura fumiferana TaxID=7141 RepID=A0ACC0KB50_CHOFU|nr:hypothetical protein MSG28_015726 [Choristoneura fumiferana]